MQHGGRTSAQRRKLSSATHSPTRERHPQSDPIVHRRSGDPAIHQRHVPGAERVADADPLARLGAARRTDVDPEIGKLHHLIPLGILEQVDRLARNDAGDRFARAPDDHLLTDQLLRVPAADRLEEEKSRIVDVRNDQADLVAMSIDQDSMRRLGILVGDDVAVHVGLDPIGQRLQEVADHLLHLLRTTCCTCSS